MMPNRTSSFPYAVLLLAMTLTVELAACCEGDAGEGITRRQGEVSRRDGGPRADAGDGGTQDGGVVASIQTHGSAVVVTHDGQAAVAINRLIGRTQGSNVEKFQLGLRASPPTLMPAGSSGLVRASQLVLHPDDNTVFAAGASEIVKYARIKETQALQTSGRVPNRGEPRGIALSPKGTYLYVANWSDGTVTVYNTADMSLKSTIDLNQSLAQSGLLGAVASRPALAHPDAVAVTDDGDEDENDEDVYVTEYFSQARIEGLPNDDSVFDLGRQGIVYRFDVATESMGDLIVLSPRRLPSFPDAAGRETGCFPNLLTVAAYNEGRVYIAGTCDSPRGPIGPVLDPASGELTSGANFQSVMHPAIFVIDTATHQEVDGASIVLTEKFRAFYEAEGTPDGPARRYPHIVSDLAFVPDTHVAYLAAYGADALFRVEWGADGAFVRVGSDLRAFVDLAPPSGDPGRLPAGLRITSDGRFAVVVNEHTRNVSFVALDNERVLGARNLAMATPAGTEATINDGRRFFVTGLGRWSYKGQAWSSCEGCHPNGLTDNVTWFMQRGPRQTPSLDGSFSNLQGAIARPFGWTAWLDEVHDFELFVRDVSGGVGAIVHRVSSPPNDSDRIHFTGRVPTPPGNQATARPQQGLNGTTASLMPEGTAPIKSVIDDWNKVLAYVQQIESPRAPGNLDMNFVASGRNVFVSASCSGCHSTEMWTVSRRFYTPSETTNDFQNGTLQMSTYTAASGFPAAVNPATDNASRTATLRDANPAEDQLSCVLRSVGTFPDEPGADRRGVAPAGVIVREVRADMTSLAQGTSGYVVPSLIGLAAGAPYFHAGNARTLEELFSTTFEPHHQAYGTFSGAMDPASLAQLIQFLLSIDDRTGPQNTPPPGMLGFEPLLCPTTF